MITLQGIGYATVVAGISGGADSTALLRLLRAAGVRVIAAHCNFRLRGAESQRDESFVTTLCTSLDIPLETVRFDTYKYAEEHSLSIEMACRELRYGFFHQLCQKHGAEAIAIAHNSDDNVETLLLNLLRGSGSKGLQGMRYRSLSALGDVIIRPLLPYSRRDIEEYLEGIGQDYITDSTNLESDYRRNFLRNRVIPLLEEKWPDAKKGILNSRAILEDENSLLEELAQKVVSHSDDAVSINYSDLDQLHSLTPLLHRIFAPLGANATRIREMEEVILKREAGRKWFVGGGEIRTTTEGILFAERWDYTDEVIIGLPEGMQCKEMEMSAEAMKEVKGNRSQDVLYIDADPRRAPFRWRHPRPGDRIAPLGMRGKSLVSDVLKDAKISPLQRAKTLLLENTQTGEIIWIKGVKRSRHNLISPEKTPVFMVF